MHRFDPRLRAADVYRRRFRADRRGRPGVRLPRHKRRSTLLPCTPAPKAPAWMRHGQRPLSEATPPPPPHAASHVTLAAIAAGRQPAYQAVPLFPALGAKSHVAPLPGYAALPEPPAWKQVVQKGSSSPRLMMSIRQSRA
ncbi:hypothetical protein CNECB9_2360003 [Cupriavidus necator]|uniref:Uncharacterized protein n=1 Tax=Cupriavidus necator TaxID=106590 RepID=A0A1K0IR86_CUPNE|nr:hypothetical protein CNECB9_2360003 [Cupriavidus necator]